MAFDVAEKPPSPTNDSPYTTEGVYLAAWLMLCGHEMQGFQMAGLRGHFLFASSPALAKDVERYFTGDASAELRAYVRAVNKARDIMMDAKRAAKAQESKENVEVRDSE